MVDLFQNLQHVYTKWENKGQHKVPLLSSSSRTSNLGPIVGADDGRCWNRRKNGLNSFHPQPRRSANANASSFVLPTNAFIGDFKTMPTMHSQRTRQRPYMGLCCSKCLASSRASLIDEKVKGLGYINALQVPAMNKDHNWIIRQFPFVYQSYRCNFRTNFPDPSLKVLKDENVLNAVEMAAATDAEELNLPEEVEVKLIKKYARRVRDILKNMRTVISGTVMRLTVWWFFRLLNRFLTSVQVNQGHVEVLKRASKADVPLVFLPLHRSHLDYILVSFVLFNNEIDVPLIASGDNLHMPVIGFLIQRLGGFFIKRRFLTKDGKKDHLYQAVMHSYMQNCLKDNRNMEFFIEGGRSRTGKTGLPKAGLLSVLIDTCTKEIIPDAYVVPVAVNYERLVDGNFVSEEMGHPKVMESFWSTIKAVWKAASCTYGMARIEFGQPFSIREIIESIRMQKKMSFRRTSLDGIPLSLNANHRTNNQSHFIKKAHDDENADERREIISYIADHISYDATRCNAMMSTNMLAFLLLNKFRKGISFNGLVLAMEWLQDELFAREKDVGFSGNMEDIVTHAISVLGQNLVKTKQCETEHAQKDEAVVLVEPVVTLPHVIELAYYSNCLTSTFVLESIIANTVYSLVHDDLIAVSDCNSRVSISKQQLQEKALVLCNILKFEFIFAPPCCSLARLVEEMIEKFVTYEILCYADSQTGNTNSNRRLHIEEWDSDNEDISCDTNLTVNLSVSSLEYLEFFRNIVSPVIESYWIVTSSLGCLVGKQMEERALLGEIRRNFHKKIEVGLVVHEESISADALRNALRLLENWKVLEVAAQDSVKILYLSDAYNNETQLTSIMDAIKQFRK